MRESTQTFFVTINNLLYQVDQSKDLKLNNLEELTIAETSSKLLFEKISEKMRADLSSSTWAPSSDSFIDAHTKIQVIKECFENLLKHLEQKNEMRERNDADRRATILGYQRLFLILIRGISQQFTPMGNFVDMRIYILLWEACYEACIFQPSLQGILFDDFPTVKLFKKEEEYMPTTPKTTALHQSFFSDVSPSVRSQTDEPSFDIDSSTTDSSAEFFL